MSAGLDLFSDYFAYRKNFLTALDCRSKVLISGAALVLIVASRNPTFPLVLGGCFLLVLALAGIPKRLMVMRLLPPLVMAAVILLLQTLMFGHTHMAEGVRLPLTLYREGFEHGLLLSSRLTGAICAILFLGFSTPANLVIETLAALRIPRPLLEMALLMYRYVFVLLEEIIELWSAQKVRNGYGSALLGLNSMGSLAGALLGRSFDQARRTYQAMLLRGYNGTMPVEKPGRMTARCLLLTSATLAVLGFLYITLEVRGWGP
jgi:cobalt/nickel transport system permease protein